MWGRLSICGGLGFRLLAADFNVTTYGAAGSGKALDTAAIQKTIDAPVPRAAA